MMSEDNIKLVKALGIYPDIQLDLLHNGFGLISKEGRCGIAYLNFENKLVSIKEPDVSKDFGYILYVDTRGFQWWRHSGQLASHARDRLRVQGIRTSWEEFLEKMIEHLT